MAAANDDGIVVAHILLLWHGKNQPGQFRTWRKSLRGCKDFVGPHLRVKAIPHTNLYQFFHGESTSRWKMIQKNIDTDYIGL
jgi:hypothetical protein